jgi:hypothetical protein
LMDPIKNLIKKNNGWALVAYAYNHSYLGGWDQEILAPGQPRQKKLVKPYLNAKK